MMFSDIYKDYIMCIDCEALRVDAAIRRERAAEHAPVSHDQLENGTDQNPVDSASVNDPRCLPAAYSNCNFHPGAQTNHCCPYQPQQVINANNVTINNYNSTTNHVYECPGCECNNYEINEVTGVD